MMSTEISFCPACAGKLDTGKDERYICDDCETHFFIQVVSEDDDDEEDEDEEKDEEDDDEEDEEEEDEEDEY